MSLLKTFPTYCVAKDNKKAKTITGRAVPTPYKAGRIKLDLCFKESGMRLPKKRAAEMGQKANAKMIPSNPAP